MNHFSLGQILSYQSAMICRGFLGKVLTSSGRWTSSRLLSSPPVRPQHSCLMVLSRVRSYSTSANMVRLTDYDVISFDLDNNILHYNLSNVFPLQYKCLSDYLVEKKGYGRDFFPVKLSEDDIDFFQRGLFLDLTRGNILYLRKDGYILKATHGTKPMTDQSVKEAYGDNKIWQVILPFLKNRLSLWDSKEARTFLDFTDSIVTLIYAKAVDFIDNYESKNGTNSDKYKAWPDVLESVVEMYKPDSGYYKTIFSDLTKYVYSVDDSFISWLKKLKENAKLILITGIEPEVGSVTLPYCLGPKYNELFDLFIFEAKKPGFFTQHRPFLTMDRKQTDKVSLNSSYINGNWETINNILKEELNYTPKCLYIGDNPIQDIHAPTVITSKLDTLAVLEEVAAEGLVQDFPYPHTKYVISKFWGPYLSGPNHTTIIGDVVRQSAKLVIPSLKVLASKPVDHEHSPLVF